MSQPPEEKKKVTKKETSPPPQPPHSKEDVNYVAAMAQFKSVIQDPRALQEIQRLHAEWEALAGKEEEL